MVLPRVGAGLDGGEPVAAVRVGQAAPHPGEVRVDRGRVLVALVDVAPGGVGLPDLHQLVGHRPPVAVEHPPGDDHPLADRVAAVGDGEVGLERVDVAVAEDRREPLDGLRVGVVQVLGRVTQQAAAVRRVVQPRLGLLDPALLVGSTDLADLGVDVGLARVGRVSSSGHGHRPYGAPGASWNTVFSLSGREGTWPATAPDPGPAWPRASSRCSTPSTSTTAA